MYRFEDGYHIAQGMADTGVVPDHLFLVATELGKPPVMDQETRRILEAAEQRWIGRFGFAGATAAEVPEA